MLIQARRLRSSIWCVMLCQVAGRGFGRGIAPDVRAHGNWGKEAYCSITANRAKLVLQPALSALSAP